MTDKIFIDDELYSDRFSEDKKLTINTNHTVQPVVLMRLGCLFLIPPNHREKIILLMLLNFSLTRERSAEGYGHMKISCPRPNLDSDFKLWTGIIWAFSRYGLTSNKIELKFSEFAKGGIFSAQRIDGRLQLSIHECLG